MKYCNNCGFAVDEDAVSCPNCNSVFPKEEKEPENIFDAFGSFENEKENSDIDANSGDGADGDDDGTVVMSAPVYNESTPTDPANEPTGSNLFAVPMSSEPEQTPVDDVYTSSKKTKKGGSGKVIAAAIIFAAVLLGVVGGGYYYYKNYILPDAESTDSDVGDKEDVTDDSTSENDDDKEGVPAISDNIEDNGDESGDGEKTDDEKPSDETDESVDSDADQEDENAEKDESETSDSEKTTDGVETDITQGDVHDGNAETETDADDAREELPDVIKNAVDGYSDFVNGTLRKNNLTKLAPKSYIEKLCEDYGITNDEIIEIVESDGYHLGLVFEPVKVKANISVIEAARCDDDVLENLCKIFVWEADGENDDVTDAYRLTLEIGYDIKERDIKKYLEDLADEYPDAKNKELEAIRAKQYIYYTQMIEDRDVVSMYAVEFDGEWYLLDIYLDFVISRNVVDEYFSDADAEESEEEFEFKEEYEDIHDKYGINAEDEEEPAEKETSESDRESLVGFSLSFAGYKYKNGCIYNINDELLSDDLEPDENGLMHYGGYIFDEKGIIRGEYDEEQLPEITEDESVTSSEENGENAVIPSDTADYPAENQN